MLTRPFIKGLCCAFTVLMSLTLTATAAALATASQHEPLAAPGATQSSTPEVHEEAIELATSSGSLRGTLMLPPKMIDTGAALPAVLILAGSGPIDHDGNAPALGLRTNSLRLLAEGLAQQGIASIRYDKRGVGASVGATESSLRIEQYVADARDWLKSMRHDSRFATLSVLGHSEGALIGCLAAQSQAPALDAVILLEAPAERAGTLLRKQLKGKLAPDIAAQSERIITALEAQQTVDGVPPALNILFRPSVQNYLISWMRYDPIQELAKVKSRVLLVQGRADRQVGSDQANRLQAVHPHSSMVLIPGMNHMLKATGDDDALQRESTMNPAMPLAGSLIPALSKFIADGLLHKEVGANN